MKQYTALLRGINVGGHHKVPMAELKKLLEKMGYQHINTLLNSGNIVFEAPPEPLKDIEEKLAKHLEDTFGFPVPTLIREGEMIKDILQENPFQGIEVTKATRLYVTFLQNYQKERLIKTPWTSEDGSFTIIKTTSSEVYGVLNVSIGKTTDAMNILAKTYGKQITTRNWNTLQKIGKLLT